ncbi:MAG: thioesterase [Gammaproteobacteria bacterium]|nr:thioesterase [Gammaproteobacteria bacterium]|tara:strand:+ start:3685 stop:4119 length:435 start_codon:yes stop_codon:yes gene_type:complete
MTEAVQMQSPHGEALGIVTHDNPTPRARLTVPYAEDLVGDPDSGVLHGGVITAALDNASGQAVRKHPSWDTEQMMATLDLRIDYMKPATPHAELVVEAECYKITRNVAFVRGVAFHDSADDPVATSVGTFMLGTRSTPREAGSR